MPALPAPSPLWNPEAASRLGALHLVARTVVEGFISGLHRSVHHGSSVEFAQHRQYTAGDDPRHLDWKVWAKTDRLYVRQYDEETNTRLYLLLDNSASMGFQSAGISKLRYGCCLAAALAWLASRQKDPTGLAVYDRTIQRFLAARLGPMHLRRLLTELDSLQPAGVTGTVDSLRWVADRIRRRSLVIVLSDLLDDPAEVIRALAGLRHKKHEILVFQLLDPAERSFPFSSERVFADLESKRRLRVDAPRIRRAYLQELDALLREYRRAFAAHGIDYELLDTAVPFEVALGRYLARRNRWR